MAGFPGCIGSTDATRVLLECCMSHHSNIHKGFKLHRPSRGFNVTSNHGRKVLSSTKGFPATWNDKSIVLFDDLIRSVHDGELFQDFEFTLLEYNEQGMIVERTYSGVWFIADNGYLPWSTTVPPYKHATSYKHIRFSEWLESMRKDIECTFGIVKK